MKTEYLYNAEGLRIQKITTETTASGTTTTTTDYILHGKNIVHLTQGNHNLHFFYDASNKPAIVDFNGTKYGYVQNLQGAIIQIIDANGAVVVEYTYDAWGKVLNVTGSMADSLGEIQPFRYRGYVYDVETGLYYLRSRYYDPALARFLSADNIIGFNLFNYCNNNPVCLFDANGKNPDWVRRKVVEQGNLLPAEATEVIRDEGGTTYTPAYYVYFDDYYDAEAAKRMNVYAGRSTDSEVLVSDIKKYSLMFAKIIENDYEWLEVIFVYEDGILCRQGYAKAEDVYVKGPSATASRKDNMNDDPINVRSKPGYSKIKYKIEQTTCVSVIGYMNGYYWISTEQGCGWIKDDYIYFA